MTGLKRIILARPGVYGSSRTKVTEQDLTEVAHTFQGAAPIVIGHAMARKDTFPRYGTVVSVTYNTKTKELIGDIELNELLAEAYEKKFYTAWSIGYRSNAEGKKYLHHLAFLGATPPAIKDLKVVQELDDSILLSDIQECEEWIFADTQNPQSLKEKSETSEKENTKNKEDEMSTPNNDTSTKVEVQEPVSTAPANIHATQEALDEANTNLADTQAQLKEIQKDELTKALQGKIPQDVHASVIALADAFPVEKKIELSDAQGAVRNRTAYQILSEIFNSLPTPVDTGELELSDNNQSSATISVDIM